MPRPARRPSCHPDQKHWGKGLCRECFTKSLRKKANDLPVGKIKRRRRQGLPPHHPLLADIPLHRELSKSGLSWLAAQQIRDLRSQGLSLAPIANFYGVPSTLVALVTSHEEIRVEKVEDGKFNQWRPARPVDGADSVFFGRRFEIGDGIFREV